jgi:hypothetical protein
MIDKSERARESGIIWIITLTWWRQRVYAGEKGKKRQVKVMIDKKRR